MNFSRKQMLFVILVPAALGVFFAGRWQGARQADRLQARLELRWPNLMTLPEPTRAVLVKSAHACDLLRESAPTPGSVESCVREGASQTGQAMPQIADADP